MAEPGRPRDASVDRRIDAAVIALLEGSGLAAVTIERVAEHADLSRPTIYRRYADRSSMVREVVARVVDQVLELPPPSDDAFADVLELLVNTIAMLTKTPIGPIYRAALADMSRDPELAALVNGVGRDRRRRLVQAVQRAVDAGVLRADLEVDTAIDAIIGAIYFRYLMTARSLDRRYARKLLQAVAV